MHIVVKAKTLEGVERVAEIGTQGHYGAVQKEPSDQKSDAFLCVLVCLSVVYWTKMPQQRLMDSPQVEGTWCEGDNQDQLITDVSSENSPRNALKLL